MESSEMRSADVYAIGIWHFRKADWWVLPIIGIAGTFYLGWLFGGAVLSIYENCCTKSVNSGTVLELKLRL